MFSLLATTCRTAVVKSAARRSLATMASPAMNDLWSATGDVLPLHPNQQTAAAATTTTTLPRTFKEALLDQEHAIVVTTAVHPHRIVHVNAAWERLCGFTKHEALHQTLGGLLQGPDTNTNLADATVRAVVDQHIDHKDMYLINYRKNGSPFKNHVTIAPCRLDLNNDQSVELLVGVLEEVETVPLRMV